jgi:hypothetical protein
MTDMPSPEPTSPLVPFALGAALGAADHTDRQRYRRVKSNPLAGLSADQARIAQF